MKKRIILVSVIIIFATVGLTTPHTPTVSAKTVSAAQQAAGMMPMKQLSQPVKRETARPFMSEVSD